MVFLLCEKNVREKKLKTGKPPEESASAPHSLETGLSTLAVAFAVKRVKI